MSKKNKHKERFQKFNIKYIVVHKTGTRTDVAMSGLDQLPYHYMITKTGKLINLRPLKAEEGVLEVALAGGLNKEGIHIDNRTEAQNETLFTTLVLLSESYPDAKIVGADEIYTYGFANPGFNVRKWISNYIPAFLEAA